MDVEIFSQPADYNEINTLDPSFDLALLFHTDPAQSFPPQPNYTWETQIEADHPQHSRRRRQVYSNTKWNEMFPIIKGMYISREMTLQEVMKELRENHDFHPTGQMLKNRFRAWGIGKNMTSAQKDYLLDDDADVPVDASSLTASVLGKVQRHARTRIKAGKPRRDVDRRLHQLRRHIPGPNTTTGAANSIRYHRPDARSKGTRSPTHLPRSLEAIDADGNSLLLFQALGASIDIWYQYRPIDDSAHIKVNAALPDGEHFINLGAFSHARRCFEDAGKATLDCIRCEGALSVFLILELLSLNEIHGVKPFREAFVRYVSSVTASILGMHHPSAIYSRSITRTNTTAHQRLALMDCMDDASSQWSDGPSIHLELANERIFCCVYSELWDLGLKYASSELKIFKARGVRQDPPPIKSPLFATRVYSYRGDHDLALSIFEQVCSSASITPSVRIQALMYRAETYDYRLAGDGRNNLRKMAADCCFQVIEKAHWAFGAADARTLGALQGALRFCKNRGWKKLADHCISTFPYAYQCLQSVTGGLWYASFQDWISND